MIVTHPRQPHDLVRYEETNTVYTTLHTSTCWRVGSASAERAGQKEVGGVTRRVRCTWWLLGLVVKKAWLAPGRPILALVA